MVLVNFYRYQEELRRVLLAQKAALGDNWDPFVAAWIAYALAVDGGENNQPLLELRDRLQRWLDDEDVWRYQRNVGPIAATMWLCYKTGVSVDPVVVERLSVEVRGLNTDDKWSPLREGEQVFLLALGFQDTDKDEVKNYLRKIAVREAQRGPVRRRVLYAAAARELGESVPCPESNPQDEGDIIALLWWAERYEGDKHKQWERFGSVQERIALDEGAASGGQRVLGIPEMAMLYEAVVKETRYPEPMLLFDYFPLHKRIRELTRIYFRDGKYTAAVFEATKALNEIIQQRSGITDKSEAELVQATMKQIGDPSKLRIRFNDCLDEDSGKNEQAGLALICEGVFKAFRNPKGHKPEDHELVQLDPYEALEQLIVISYLMKRIEKAKVESR